MRGGLERDWEERKRKAVSNRVGKRRMAKGKVGGKEKGSKKGGRKGKRKKEK